jgi:hypothetical protein
VKRRLYLLAVLGLGAVLWKGGFGFLATERSLSWRLPVRHGEVRRLDLQLWAGQTLLKREELETPGGLTAEPVSRLGLERGQHRAVATLWLASAPRPVVLRQDFDPGTDADIVLSFPDRAPPSLQDGGAPAESSSQAAGAHHGLRTAGD